MQEKARTMLHELDSRLLVYILNSHTGEEYPLSSHNVETSIEFGEKVAQKISSELKSQDIPALGAIALRFVERTWIQSGLELIEREDLRKIIGGFLNACPKEIQNYLEKSSPDHDLTLLQQVKNRVINPITGQMDIK